VKINGVNVVLRESCAGDEAFVSATWVRSVVKSLKPHNYERAIRWIRPQVEKSVSLDTVRVACLEEDPNVILAWAAWRDGEPIYAYTTKNEHLNMRRQGLATLLTAKAKP
jgi:hypothetical protein